MNQDEVRASIKAECVANSGQDPAMDIVDRLRERAGQNDEYDWHGAIEREAADEIERLRGQHGGKWQELSLDFPEVAGAVAEYLEPLIKRIADLEAQVTILDRPVQ